jgi:hypothetical protein
MTTGSFQDLRAGYANDRVRWPRDCAWDTPNLVFKLKEAVPLKRAPERQVDTHATNGFMMTVLQLQHSVVGKA